MDFIDGIEQFINWLIPKILYLCGFVALAYAIIALFFPKAFDILNPRYSLALSFIGLGIAIIAFTRNSEYTPKIFENFAILNAKITDFIDRHDSYSDLLEKIRRESDDNKPFICTKDICVEINLHAIDIKSKLLSLEKTIEGNHEPSNIPLRMEMKSKYDSIFSIGVIMLILGIIIGIFFAYFIINPPKNDMQKLDESYHILQNNFIHNAGEARIDYIVNNTSSLRNDPKKLTQIADMITRDFTDPNWAYQQNEDFFCYYPNDTTHYNYCLIVGQMDITKLAGQSYANVTYVSDKLGHIRQGYGNDLSTDPYWIAFQKTGECQELSVLFNKVANESGFVTSTIWANGIKHAWNEVLIDGECKYFDVQKYGEVRGKGDPSQWFGNRSDYSSNTGFPLKNLTEGGVCVHDWQNNTDIEDVTLFYDPTNRSSHGNCEISNQ
jgi:hypothetical protein